MKLAPARSTFFPCRCMASFFVKQFSRTPLLLYEPPQFDDVFLFNWDTAICSSAKIVWYLWAVEALVLGALLTCDHSITVRNASYRRQLILLDFAAIWKLSHLYCSAVFRRLLMIWDDSAGCKDDGRGRAGRPVGYVTAINVLYSYDSVPLCSILLLYVILLRHFALT